MSWVMSGGHTQYSTYHYTLCFCCYNARSCALSGRVAAGGRFPGLKPRSKSYRPLRGEEPSKIALSSRHSDMGLGSTLARFLPTTRSPAPQYLGYIRALCREPRSACDLPLFAVDSGSARVSLLALRSALPPRLMPSRCPSCSDPTHQPIDSCRADRSFASFPLGPSLWAPPPGWPLQAFGACDLTSTHWRRLRSKSVRAKIAQIDHLDQDPVIKV
jgi:hypothetical protein